jgi:hypothetical protein
MEVIMEYSFEDPYTQLRENFGKIRMKSINEPMKNSLKDSLD